MDSKLRVLISTSIFPNNEEANKGIYIFHQVKALSNYCNLKVVAPVPFFPRWIRSKKYSFYSKIKGKETIRGVEVFHPRVLVIPKMGRSFYGFFYASCLLGLMKKLKRDFQPDIIISFWAYPDGFANVLLAKLLRIPVILGGRGCDINYVREFGIKKMMVVWALRRSDKVLAVSEAMKIKMCELGVPGNKVKVIPNGFDDIFKPDNVREKENFDGKGFLNERDKTIIFCGRLSPEKGLRYLIGAAKILLERNIPFKLVLVGEGPQKIQIRQLTKDLGLMDKVQFKDEVPHGRIPDLLNSSDIFCLPSVREGWPNTVMEALACGIPVVASSVGGVPEILTSPDYGIMVPKEDSVALANGLMAAIQKAWNRDKIRESLKGRTWDVVGKEIFDEITLVLGS